MNSFYLEAELQEIGFKSFGKNVLVSRKSSIYNPSQIELGDNVRIDDFCILSGKIKIGNYVHIAAFCGLYAGNIGIKIDNFSGLSPNVMIFAISDDFSGDVLVGSTIPFKYRKLISGEVVLEKYVQIGTGSVVLPHIMIKEGVAVGAMSLVLKSLDSWSIYCGQPVKKIKDRSRNILELEKQLLKELK